MNNLFETIQRLCKDRNITIAALERECGLGNATIKKWGVSIPSGDRLSKVADYFGVSVDYLLGRENRKESNHDPDLRKIERARKRMSQKDKDRMTKMLELSFEEYFNNDFEDNDIDE